MLRLHKPMRSRRRNAEDAPICHGETGKAERTKMQSRKTYRTSCAGVLCPMGAPCSSASCDGQDGRLFSCEKVPPAATGLLYAAVLCEVWRSCIWGSTE